MKVFTSIDQDCLMNLGWTTFKELPKYGNRYPMLNCASTLKKKKKMARDENSKHFTPYSRADQTILSLL